MAAAAIERLDQGTARKVSAGQAIPDTAAAVKELVECASFSNINAKLFYFNICGCRVSWGSREWASQAG